MDTRPRVSRQFGSERWSGRSLCSRCSLRQPHFPHQLSKPWVGTYGIEYEVSLQVDQSPIAVLISGVKPSESLIFVFQGGIEHSNRVRRQVTSLTLRLPDFNAFGESALPAPRTKSLLQSKSKFGFVCVAGKLAVGLPFFNDLRVHTFLPISIC